MLGSIRECIPHQVFENIFLYQESISFGHLQCITIIREMLQGIQVGVEFIIQATLQPSALATELGLVDGKILVSSRRGIYRFKIGKPAAAA